ncbi:MAG TPA: hypothetical protein VF720_04690, partial [Candidatus Eisenbacteria bacterium]
MPTHGIRATSVAPFVLAAILWPFPAHAQASDRGSVRQRAALDSVALAVRTLQSRVDSLTAADRDTPLSVASASPGSAPAPRAGGAYMNISFDGLVDFGWSSEADVRSLEMGDHDPLVRGFTIPNAEISLDGTVDPHFKGFSNIVLKLDE